MAPRCGGTLSYEVGTKHENYCECVSNKKDEKKRDQIVKKKKSIFETKPKMFDVIAKCHSITNLQRVLRLMA